MCLQQRNNQKFKDSITNQNFRKEFLLLLYTRMIKITKNDKNV
jgi:hypothetical protein